MYRTCRPKITQKKCGICLTTTIDILFQNFFLSRAFRAVQKYIELAITLQYNKQEWPYWNDQNCQRNCICGVSASYWMWKTAFESVLTGLQIRMRLVVASTQCYTSVVLSLLILKVRLKHQGHSLFFLFLKTDWWFCSQNVVEQFLYFLWQDLWAPDCLTLWSWLTFHARPIANSYMIYVLSSCYYDTGDVSSLIHLCALSWMTKKSLHLFNKSRNIGTFIHRICRLHTV